jgi:hypothetical protein
MTTLTPIVSKKDGLFSQGGGPGPSPGGGFLPIKDTLTDQVERAFICSHLYLSLKPWTKGITDPLVQTGLKPLVQSLIRTPYANLTEFLMPSNVDPFKPVKDHAALSRFDTDRSKTGRVPNRRGHAPFAQVCKGQAFICHARRKTGSRFTTPIGRG